MDSLVMETLLELKEDVGEIKSGVKEWQTSHEKVCADVEDLKKEKWIRHGATVIIASIISLLSAIFYQGGD